MPAMLNRIWTSCVSLAHRFGWGRVFSIALLVALVGLRVWDPAALKLARLKTFDLYQIAKPRVPTTRPVMIVDIDDASLNEFGQWPWPRTVLAKLVEKIARGGASAIGLDIVFAEPDRTSPGLLVDGLPHLSEAARAELRAMPDHDTIFANIIKRTRIVLGQSAYKPRAGDTRTVLAPKASFATLGADPNPYLIEYPELLSNLPILEEAAKGRGMFTVIPDPDGLVRRVPIVLKAGGNMIPSLSADMLRVATGQTTYVIKTGKAGVQSVVLAGIEIPTDANAQLWIYYSHHDPKRFVSAADVINSKTPPNIFKGKLVLIGASATGLLDIRSTPIEPVMPGVELHAQALENIITRTSLNRPSYTIGAELCLTLVVGFTFVVLAPILGALPIAALGTVLAGLVSGLAWYLFTQKNILLDVAYPLIGGLMVFVTMVFVNYVREEAQRQQIRGAFSQYISPDLVSQLAKDPDRLVLGGETRELSILFSDVRGFTSISESYKKNPQRLTSLLNRLLTPLSHAILEYNGTIDKYMGDAVMAFWNAPLDNADHAADACAASLKMMEDLDQVNAERESEAKESGTPHIPLRIGIGINTGECVVGNMGSDIRFDYTVLGDSVNLASRLEGQSETFGVPIILGSRTAGQVKDRFAVLELDVLRVKGKKEPEVVYTLLGTNKLLGDETFKALQTQMDKLLSAYRNRKWTVATKALSALRNIDTHLMSADLSALFELYEGRIREFKKNPPPKNWDGVFTLTTK
jgi:adenylate cyclase